MTTTGDPIQLDLEAVNRQLGNAAAPDVVSWAVDTFPRGLVMTTSFGTQSAVLLHVVTRIVPDIAVIWIDTGFNFPETYRFADQLAKQMDLNLKVYQAHQSPARMVALQGKLWEKGKSGLDAYDRQRKVEPRDRAFRELKVKAWLTGPRREQTTFRQSLCKVELFNGAAKIHPILDWSTKQVHAYLKRHDLPYHPLYELGYRSIGDWHSTVSVTGEMADRSGRFRGLKQECGLHLPQTVDENASRDSSAL